MEVIRHGKYKSAVEKYLSQEMSEANRDQITVFLESIWKEMKNEISDSRAISVEQLDLIADSLLARTPKLAVASASHQHNKPATHRLVNPNVACPAIFSTGIK